MTTTSIHIGAKSPVGEAIEKPKEIKRSIRQKSLMDHLNNFMAEYTRIKTSDKVSFFRLLATMINAGISIVKALHILSEQTENAHMKKITENVAERIESGSSFSESLLAHPKVFSEAQVGMVEAGEASGRLNQTLLQIATEAEKSSSLTSKIKSAMIYPVVVVIIMLGAAFVVMTYVMPKIKDMFESLGGELPALTQALISASDFMTSKTLGISNALLVLLTAGCLIAVFSWWKKTKTGAYIWAEIVFHIPVFGKLSKKVALARFCRGLSTMISSGISIIKALYITAASVGNTVYERRIKKIADDVKQGITMAENMKDDTKHFPTMLVGMMSVAEQTAQIDTISEKLASYYEDEANDMVKGLSSLMEPIIVVILGLGVGFLVVAVMLPILSASDLASG